MKTISWGAIGAALLFVVLSTASRADGSGNGNSNSVRWETIIGIIQAGNIVGGTTTGIVGGGEPWSTLGAAMPMSIWPTA